VALAQGPYILINLLKHILNQKKMPHKAALYINMISDYMRPIRFIASCYPALSLASGHTRYMMA